MTLPNTTRRGFSMVELLIVIAISMLLIAISIPLIRPMLASNRLREATRQLNAFIIGAKARAAETGRPYGIRLVRSSVDATGDPNECYRVQYIEVPPFYSGDIEGAMITVGGPALPGTGYLFYASVPSGDPANLLLANAATDTTLISEGDMIRFGYAGIWYRIVDIYSGLGHSGNNNDTVLQLTTLSTTTAPPAGTPQWPINPADASIPSAPYSTAPRVLPYQIMRKPQVAGTTTLELPHDTSIDLSLSGSSIGGVEFFAGNNVGPYDPTFADPSPVDIVFDPNGQMKYLATQGVMAPVSGTIYLHIGQTENVVTGVGGRGMQPNPSFPATQLAASQNLLNSDNYWVAIQYPTGSVLTAENVGGAAPDIVLARDIVRSGVAKGSR
jgi:type II secretory pathway pseudopilin PulG